MAKGSKKRARRNRPGTPARVPKPRGRVVETLELSRPIQAYGREIEVLEFHEMTAGDLRAMDAERGAMGQGIALVARSVGLSPEDIDQLSLEDFEEAIEIVDRFSGGFMRKPGGMDSRQEDPEEDEDLEEDEDPESTTSGGSAQT